MNIDKLIIIGASGHGKVVAEIAVLGGNYDQIYFMDDNLKDEEFSGYKNLGSTDSLYQYREDHDFFVAIGDNRIRKKILNKLIDMKINLAVLVHPMAIVSDSTQIGKGSVVMAGAVLNSSVEVGKGTIINTNASIDHDGIIGNYCHISPGSSIAGTVKIGDEVWVGTNATIINNVTILDEVIIGAGSVVLNSIKKTGTYVGVPIKRIK